MKKNLAASMLLTVSLALLGSQANAGIPRAAVTSLSAQVFAIYMSADATCQTGLIATIPLSRTAQLIDFTQRPILGTGFVPSSVNCIVVVMKNNVGTSWASGTYATTSGGLSDTVCNAGGSLTRAPCNNGRAVTWPGQIVSDMAAAGLPMISACTNATGAEIVPLYLSSNSACTGNASVDALIGQAGCNPDGFTSPGAAGSTTGGFLMGGATAQAAYAFIADPDVTIGNLGGACSILGPPRMGSRGASTTTAAAGTPGSPSIIAIKTGSGALAAGPTGSASSVTVTGSGFSQAARVTLGSSSCANPIVNAAGTQITCTTAGGSVGVVDTTVTNADSGLVGISGSSFEYRASPSITGLSPTHFAAAFGNRTITITASGLRQSNSLGVPSAGAYTGTVVTGKSGNLNVACTSPTIVTGTTMTCTVGASGVSPGRAVTVTNGAPDSLSGTRTGSVSTGFNFD